MRRVLLVRHAECDMNLTLATRIGGRANESPLTPLGVKQAEALGKHLAVVMRHTRPGPCFASTAVRAEHTARAALTAYGAPDHSLTLSEELLELSQGSWEGAVRSECYTPEVLAAISADPWNFASPGGESQHQVEDRLMSFLITRVLPAVTPGGPPALVVSHGLAIKTVLRCILGSAPVMTRKIITDNTSVTEIAWYGPLPAAWAPLSCDDPASPAADADGSDCAAGAAAATAAGSAVKGAGWQRHASDAWEVVRVNDTSHLALAGLLRIAS